MYGAFSDSASIDSGECKESLKGFPQKVSPTSFVIFFETATSKDTFW